MEGEGQVSGNPSSALTSTVMVDGVLYRFKLRSSESTITGSKAPKSSHYVDLSEYPPGTDIEYELHWDGSRVVSKVPRWAHEKWLRKYHDPDGTIAPEDASPLRDAVAFADGGSEDHPKASATAVLARPHIREAIASRLSCMASGSGPNKGTKALKRPSEDPIENPSPSATAYGGDSKSSASAFPFGYPYAYADQSGLASDDYPGRYAYSVEDDGRVALKVDKYAAPYIKIGGTRSSELIEGVYHTNKVPEVLKANSPPI